MDKNNENIKKELKQHEKESSWILLFLVVLFFVPVAVMSSNIVEAIALASTVLLLFAYYDLHRYKIKLIKLGHDFDE